MPMKNEVNGLHTYIKEFIITCIWGFAISYTWINAKDISFSGDSLKKDSLKIYSVYFSMLIVPLILQLCFGLTTKIEEIIIGIVSLSILGIIGVIIMQKVVEKVNQKDIEEINKKLKE